MNNKEQPLSCAVCGGSMMQGQTTVTIDYGTGVLVVRNVPATICSQCGNEWIDDQYAEKIETFANEAKNKHSVVEVLSLSA